MIGELTKNSKKHIVRTRTQKTAEKDYDSACAHTKTTEKHSAYFGTCFRERDAQKKTDCSLVEDSNLQFCQNCPVWTMLIVVM